MSPDQLVKHIMPYHSSTPPPSFFFKGGNGLPQNWAKGGIEFFLNKGKDRKRGWVGVIRGGGMKKIYKIFSISSNETQTFKAY